MEIQKPKRMKTEDTEEVAVAVGKRKSDYESQYKTDDKVKCQGIQWIWIRIM